MPGTGPTSTQPLARRPRASPEDEERGPHGPARPPGAHSPGLVGLPQALACGPVFPCRRGARAHERKGKGRSYASALRDAPWAVGIARPPPAPSSRRHRGRASEALPDPVRLPSAPAARRSPAPPGLQHSPGGPEREDRDAPGGPPQRSTHMRYAMRTTIRASADRQNTNGTAAMSQGAVLLRVRTRRAGGPPTNSRPEPRVWVGEPKLQ